MDAIWWIALFGLLIGVGYLYLPALASLRRSRPTSNRADPKTRFMIAIPAHNEEPVIGRTVERLKSLDYPSTLLSIHVVADHCTDRTAEQARKAGASVHERSEGPRTGKGAALNWLFDRALDPSCTDAVVVFDSDTVVAPDFLRLMDARLSAGAEAVQGQHVIRNPEAGLFPALTWAMFLIDNRLQNLGRANLGWSAKNMGDSICIRAETLRRLGWGEGLTEDYQLRHRLLLEGVVIGYEPDAKGFGEAPSSWGTARAQRARWLRGTHDSSRQHAARLLAEGLRRRNITLLDGALQAYLPSYSSLTMLALGLAGLGCVVYALMGRAPSSALFAGWCAAIGMLIGYPFLGLLAGKAPLRAYFAVLMGPAYVVWRTWLAVVSRFRGRQVVWIRTPHGDHPGARPT
jgi:cellulose synthase/poly-beta-1,6-N-acetylglucosamine synthase-like glycosyltransferase